MEQCEPTFPWPICQQPAVSTSVLPSAAEWPVKHGPHVDGAYLPNQPGETRVTKLPPVVCRRPLSQDGGRAVLMEIRMADAGTDPLMPTALTRHRG